MWSMLSQDFSDIAEALKTESAGFMGYLEHIASSVVGRGDVYAGDEALGKTVTDTPLPNAVLRRFQDAESTYTLPIQPEERAAFEAWAKASHLSSANAPRRQQHMAAGTPLSKSEEGLPAGTQGQISPLGTTPNRPSAEYPDEPINEARHRLLGYNEVVLQRYVSLVGGTLSSRSSVSASPEAPERRRWQGGSPSFPAKCGEGEGRSCALDATSGRPPPGSASSLAKTPECGRVSEDDFFDRYFFRLSQLRDAELRRRCEAPPQVASVSTSVAASPTSAAVPETPSSSPQLHMSPTDDRSRQSTEDDDFAVVPLFAKRVMSAASGFVTGIDNALNSVVAGEVSRCSGAASEATPALNEDSANVDPKDLVHYRGAKQQVEDLESMVQELQEALRQERRRVAQLTSALEERGIEVPAGLMTPALPSTAAAPAKKAKTRLATVLTPACHTKPTTATPAGTTAGTSSTSGGASDTLLTASTAAPPPSHQKPSRASSFTQSTSGEMISAATEEDTWVCMSPGVE
ncbi:hypothetical protein LSCM1_05330 [Leishmania martiniquensis]|uniref:Uncharacterized protein n=1 Tax=Leishmania martiniquensis TaxID=1580590 RepID=A0A836HFR5_9TRYP|nr:hypothetical protein LSCM1_05330 [Leishmania martiniquensis]